MDFSALRRRAVRAVRNYFHRDWKPAALINFDDVPKFIRTHMSQFYFSVICMMTSSAVGAYFTEDIEQLISVFGFTVSFILFNHVVVPWSENKRLLLLMLVAFFGWASATPWITWFLGIDTGFVVTTLVATDVGVACFWASSLMATHFEDLYFRAIVLTIILMLSSLFKTSGAFGGDSDRWLYQIYVLLLWVMVYVAAYSQEEVMKTRGGDHDYVQHALNLFPHFPAFAFHFIKEMWKLRRR